MAGKTLSRATTRCMSGVESILRWGCSTSTIPATTGIAARCWCRHFVSTLSFKDQASSQAESRYCVLELMRAGGLSVCFSEEQASVGGRFASVFVFEIGVHVHALGEPGIEALSPGYDLLGSVVFQAQAGVGGAGCEHFRRCLLVGLGQTERRLVLAKNGVRFVGIPRRVTYLKGERESRRAKTEKVFQQRAIEFEVGRELNQDGAKVVAVVEDAGDFQKSFQSALAVAEPLNVRDFLVDLQGKAKALRYALGPVQKRALGGHAIETVIDLDCRELLGVEGEHFAVRKLLGVEATLPLFVGVSGSAYAKLAWARNRMPPWSELNHSRGAGKTGTNAIALNVFSSPPAACGG